MADHKWVTELTVTLKENDAVMTVVVLVAFAAKAKIRE